MKNNESIYIIILFYIISFSTCIHASEKRSKLPDIEEYQLDNGMRVLISPNYDNPIVYIALYLHAGTLDDPIDQIALAEYTFRSLNEGTSKYPREKDIKEKLFSLGSTDGEFNHFNLEDGYGYIENYFLKGDVRAGIELFSEVIINPTFPQLGEFWPNIILRILPKKTFIGTWNLTNTHLKNQFANRRGYLHPKYAIGYGKKKMKNWHKKYIRPKNITLMVTGDINYIYIKKLVDEYFGNWKSTEPMPERREYPINLTENSGIKLRFINIKERENPILRIITKGPSYNDNWHLAGNMARVIFGNRGFSSRLAMVHEKFNRYGHLYYNWALDPRLPHSIIYSETKYSDLSKMYHEILIEFEKMKNNSITKKDLEKAKNIELNSYNNMLNNPRHFSDFIQERYNNNGYSINKISKSWDNVEDITLSEANNAAAKIFDPENFMILVMGNKDSCATFLNQFDNVEYYKHTEELR